MQMKSQTKVAAEEATSAGREHYACIGFCCVRGLVDEPVAQSFSDGFAL